MINKKEMIKEISSAYTNQPPSSTSQ